jgi:hypothetical protein
MSNQLAENPRGKYKDLPAEIDRMAILKTSAKQLHEWAKEFGFENLNLRLHGLK